MKILKSKKKILKIRLLVFSLVLVVVLVFGGILIHMGIRNKKKEVYRINEVYAARMETLLSTLFHKTDVLEAIILTNNAEISESTFQAVAKSLDTEAGIRAIQYLPEGVVEYCYPIEGNEAAIGDNIFEIPERQADAILAVKTKSIALSGPYELSQGGLGLIARNPIFLLDKNGEEHFWGFAAIILDLPEALSSVGLDNLIRAGYHYQLYFETEAGERLIIDEAGSFDPKQAISTPIQVPNHIWTLSITPSNGWTDWKWTAAVILIALCLGIPLANRIGYFFNRHDMFQFYATRDELTGLLNRRGILDASEHFLKEQKPFFFLYMDLNKFKMVNDKYGHLIGDSLLKEFANRLKTLEKNKMVCGRLGGDEFVLILLREKGSSDTIEEIVPVIRKKLEYPFESESGILPVSVSIGTAAHPEECNDYDQLIKIADERMYQNKRCRKEMEG